LLRYEIVFAYEVRGHLQFLTSREKAIVLDRIERHLRHDPRVPSRNRKLMRPGWMSTWELRLGNLRVYFEAEDEPFPIVSVVAVGRKERDVVRIGNVIVAP
jgi:mRNA-degrading endonuclease RelE of RelBE toxin-antitoxin system